MPQITLSNGATFTSESGESLLEAAARSGVAFPYSCRKGRCSSCKCRAISGNSISRAEETPLSEQERAAGWILGCVRTAIGDMTIEVDDLGGREIPDVKTLPCRVQSLEKLAYGVIKVILRLPPTRSFAFLPGQYIDVVGQGGARRSYSLANTFAADGLLELHIAAVPGGVMSDYWFGDARVNDLLRINGPLGTFFLRDIAGMHLIFLATGTGIAPIKSMLGAINSTANESKPLSVTVYWGARTWPELYWDVNGAPGSHRYVPVLSRANGDWSGARGYVQNVAMAENPDLSEAIVYACGSDAMIHGAKAMLLEAGLPEHRFFSDAFVSSATE